MDFSLLNTQFEIKNKQILMKFLAKINEELTNQLITKCHLKDDQA